MILAWSRLQRQHPALKFALVGGAGFIVDTTILILLYDFIGFGLLLARTIAFVVAATSNWILNRQFTFNRDRHSGTKSTQWLRFVSSAMISALPNLGIFYLIMLLLPESLPNIIFAMSCGILAGYYCNYRLAKSWVFRSI